MTNPKFPADLVREWRAAATGQPQGDGRILVMSSQRSGEHSARQRRRR